MKRFYKSIFFLWLTGVLLILAAGQARAAPGASSATLPVVLNEVMPKPERQDGAWVELYVGVQPRRIFLPLTLLDGAGAQVSAAVVRPGVSLAGWQVSNELGFAYALPQALNAVPNDTYILILFDGKGPAHDDYDATDGKIVLHTPPGLLDIFPDDIGQAALYRPGQRTPETIVDFVAWTSYQEGAAANAVAAGLWPRGQAVSFENGFGDISNQDQMERNESLGRFPGARGHGPQVWANYPAPNPSPGRGNGLPPVTFITPENNARVFDAPLSLSWRDAPGATGYQLQLARASDFIPSLINIVTPHTYYKPDPKLAPGVYFWRIRPLGPGLGGAWFGPFKLEVVSASAQAAAVGSEKVLGIARVRQNKDSYMLGLDGAPEGDPTTDTPENAWDSPAPCTQPPCADYTKYKHGRMYCLRASVRMMASYYNGGQILSMDRISYHIFEEWSGATSLDSHDGIPDNDLGFDRGTDYPDEEDEAISWALNTTIHSPGGKPTFNQIKGWIDANRPIMFRRPGHIMVIDGYRDNASGQFMHVLDPDQPPDLERWQDYSTQTIEGYWVGPASGTGRADETSVWADSDGDGIMDFDETVRFNLDPYDPDTDGDWVADKRDMREYVFDAAGNYSKRASDFDGDSLRKERDPDNDNDGSPEGCEDTNRNGILNAGETDNFDAADSQACVPLFNILYPLKIAQENAGDPANPDKILVQVSTAVPAGWTLSLSPSDFSVDIGSHAASVLAVYPSADTYFLVVQAPTQASPDYYDLKVTLAGAGSDDEQDAVFYLPKNPNDEVIVLDRSGSMAAHDKIGAAQNAASAFVDFLSDGDFIGVTSFATSASVDYTLHKITGASVRTNAIAAIDGLSAGGTTALGQGAQTGYGQLTAHGDPAHDWSMVLLSDGWENVSPYWADVQASITNAVVHSVALGEDADTALLQSIAGAKHGQYFYVDVNPPTAALAANSSTALVLPPLGLPNTLPNRLADVYTAVGELTHGYQRWAERTGSAAEGKTFEFNVSVPEGAPQAIFSLNWDDPAGYLRMLLNDPKGQGVTADAERVGETHHQLVVKKPMPGLWLVTVRILKPTSEYHFMLSGSSQTTLLAAVGGRPEARTVGVPVPIYGVLTDEKRIAGADVYALFAGPGLGPDVGAASIGSRTLQLYDDGHHADGKADDGVYGNLLTGVTQPGGYTVKVVAAGENNSGEPFLRYANAGFNVRPQAVYLWNEDLDTALEYEKLLEANGWSVDLMTLSAVGTADLRPYSLIVVGPETGQFYTFDDPDAAGVLAQWDLPILGLGEGGAALFAELDLYIGYGHTWYSRNNQVYAVDPASDFWNEPFRIPVTDRRPLATLYPESLMELGVYIPKPPLGVTPVARERKDDSHYPVVQEVRRGRKFALWGYNAGPPAMTSDGRKLLVNLSDELGR